jgi:AcrR family transcriptional regulator
MPTRRRKSDVLNEFRRSELMRSARHVFGSKGFEHATMDAIAREADVAKGTIYLYYSSKQAIYEAAFRTCMAELEQVTRENVTAAGSVQDAIAAFVETRVKFFQERRDFFRMYIDEIGSQVAASRQRRSACAALLGRQMQVLEDVFRKAVQDGTMREIDPAAAARAVFDLTRGLVARELLAQEHADPAHDVTLVTDLIWAGLKPARRKHTQ